MLAFPLVLAGVCITLSGCGGDSPTPAPTDPPAADYTDLGTGACRTEAGEGGTFTCEDADAAACKTLCSANPNCAAYETTTAVDSDSKCKGQGEEQDKKCELHWEAITK